MERPPLPLYQTTFLRHNLHIAYIVSREENFVLYSKTIFSTQTIHIFH